MSCRSEFSCCQQEDYTAYNYGGYGSKNLFGPKNPVGSCDWSINWFATATVGATICPWVPVVDGVTYKVGTAYGTCYFGSGSELCGEPMCSTMVVSVQGDVYRCVYGGWMGDRRMARAAAAAALSVADDTA